MTSIEEYITPELLVLIPVLYLIGMSLKRYQGVSDRYIPLVLGVFGIVIAMIYECSVLGFSGEAVYTSIIQGVLCAGAAVYGNQLLKQASKGE